jgi:hypothetical protein
MVIATWCYNEKSNKDILKNLIEPINDHYASTMHSLKEYKESLIKNDFKIIVEEDDTNNLLPYWNLRKQWQLKSGIEENFIKGFNNKDLLYVFLVGKK